MVVVVETAATIVATALLVNLHLKEKIRTKRIVVVAADAAGASYRISHTSLGCVSMPLAYATPEPRVSRGSTRLLPVAIRLAIIRLCFTIVDMKMQSCLLYGREQRAVSNK